jgi:hypothetical protein
MSYDLGANVIIEPCRTVAFFGDSLLDTGNLTKILAPSGIEPFPNPPYKDGKASNGQVLGEAVLDELGIDPNSLIPRFRLLRAATTFNPLQDNINYAVASATTGVFGSEGNDLDFLPIGLQSQVALFKKDFATARLKRYGKKSFFDWAASWKKDFTVARESALDEGKPDVILSAGSNDVFDVLVDLERFANVLFTPEEDDDRELINGTANKIVDNLNKAIDRLESTIDDAVIFGLSPLGDTPFSIQVDTVVDSLLSGGSGSFAGQTRELLTDIAEKVNSGLTDKYDGDGLDVEDVLVIDGIEIFEQGLNDWKDSLSLTPYTDISYADYLGQIAQGNPNNLPSGLVAGQFAFIDGVHPTSDLNKFFASQAAPLIREEFPNFGII